MKCENCPYRMTPFFVCKKYKWNLKEDPEVIGCAIDGELPPLPVVVPPRIGGKRE